MAKTYSITQATLAIGYRGRSDRRLRSLPVTITVPHRSTLKDLTEIERLLATKYLQKWGLVAQPDVS
ncbi:hypothetical protein [Mesorhizobium sp. CN2-181]|uniref:hypothetical protein n=1 Tax=Mesorhizobium yinganensis TaxID=3157707 RepID=UPI0032B83B06